MKESLPHDPVSETDALLKSVSRSFYLSIRFLPAAMREPVALSYLLARLTDTVADVSRRPAGDRIESLQLLRERITLPGDTSPVPDLAAGVEREGERHLAAAAGELFDWLERLDEPNRNQIRKVLATIISGQIWDLEFFDLEKNRHTTREQLLEYTYRVAGCVGEFWTEIGYINLGRGFAHPADRERLLVSGRRFGQGLQLINIIRDMHEDLPAGRNYLPHPRIGPAELDEWLAICREFLSDGEDYVVRVRNRRVRFATALPLIMADETASALRAAGVVRVKSEKIKISRKKVWTSAARALLRT